MPTESKSAYLSISKTNAISETAKENAGITWNFARGRERISEKVKC